MAIHRENAALKRGAKMQNDARVAERQTRWT
jgi:hypothetical protein